MTGKYAQGHGMYQNHFPLRGDQEFLADTLAAEGYQTLYVGKWHLEGGPKPGYVPPQRRFGFERFAGFNRGHQYMNGIFWRDSDQPYRCGRYEPDFQTDHMMEFIDDALTSDPDRPFFGIVSYGPPHHPNEMPRRWRDMYGPGEVGLPPAALGMEHQAETQRRRLEIDCLGNSKAALKSRCRNGAKSQLEPESEEEICEFIAEYYGMISNIDFNVGRLLNHLDARGVADNTMVVFLSDHGDMLGEHGYYCGFKPQPFRSAMQVPLIVRYPGITDGGSRNSSLIDVGVDVPVTLLDMTDSMPFSHSDGVSFRPILEGAAEGDREAVFYQTFRMDDGNLGEFTPVPERGIRTRDWLYVRQPRRRKLLIDQSDDPLELTNLVAAPGYEALMDEFDRRIHRHMDETEDDWDLHHEFPPPDFLTHEEADRHLNEVLLPRAIEVP